MLKYTIMKEIDIGNYGKLVAFLKRQNDGYKPPDEKFR